MFKEDFFWDICIVCRLYRDYTGNSSIFTSEKRRGDYACHSRIFRPSYGPGMRITSQIWHAHPILTPSTLRNYAIQKFGLAKLKKKTSCYLAFITLFTNDNCDNIVSFPCLRKQGKTYNWWHNSISRWFSATNWHI